MKRPFVIGLTGSIGMGKSTTADLFAEENIPTWSADAAVHRLYAKGGAAVAQIADICPAAIREGRVDRKALSDWIAQDPEKLRRIEMAVHPLVKADRELFVETASAPIVVLDIPLLLETHSEVDVDIVVVVSVDEEIQRKRVLARPGMTSEKLDLILSKQIPDGEKRKVADFVIETKSIERARRDVKLILEKIRSDGAK